MKTKSILTSLVLAMILAGSCDDNSASETESVETYISLLRADQYDSIMLPEFTFQDIPALLAYRNETQIITKFPRNPISSFHNPNCTLGMYALWTIESIRARAINSKSVILRFPSQNPVLALRNSNELVMVSDNTSHQVAAQAYYDWWTSNSHQEFNAFKNIDPLLGTNYRWH